MFAVFFISLTVVSAQGISIGATGGLTTITGPESYTNDISEGGAGFSTGAHFGVKGKFSLPLIPLRITGQVLYTKFSADGEANLIGVPNAASVENELSFFVYGVGAEYSFAPGPISPYLGLDLFMTSFGDFKQTYDSGGSTTEITSSGESRTGIGIGGGLEFGLIPMIDIDVSAKYNINNLIGKNDGEDTFSTLNFSATLFLGL